MSITILYTGDIHAHIDAFLRAAHVAQVQRYELNAVGRHVLLLDSGDVEDRALLESDVSKGAALFRLLKAAEYQASAVGNGAALSYGPQVLKDIATASELPLLCANLLTRGAKPAPFPGTRPALIIPCGAVWIGLIGLTSPFNGLYEQFFPVTMPDPAEVTRQHLESLRQQGCQIVGVLSHMGYDFDVKLAEEVAGLDFIIGGHSHTILPEPTVVNHTPICHAGDYGNYLGRLDLLVDDEGHLARWQSKLIEVPAEGPKHIEAERLWERIRQDTQNRLHDIVGTLAEDADLASDRACIMGQVLADALRLRMKADVALCITGHLHEGLRRGPITLGNLFGITSSPANPALADLTGAQIIRALEYGADPIVWQQSPRTLRGTQIGLLQVSGITYQLDKFYRVSDVRVLGQPIEPNRIYHVAATDYELIPQRGYFPELNPQSITFDAAVIVREVLQAHFAQFYPLIPGTRLRITFTEQEQST